MALEEAGEVAAGEEHPRGVKALKKNTTLQLTGVESLSPPSRFGTLYRWLFLACVAVLPMSSTVALRNLFLLALLLLLLIDGLSRTSDWGARLRAIPTPLLVWFSFLILFPVWSVYPDEAWDNFRGQWLQSMIAWIVGLGAVWVMGRHGPSLIAVAWASSFAVLVHLLSFIAAWAGVFGSSVPKSLTFGQVWGQIKALVESGFLIWPGWQHIPMEFHGVESMHGNLGYTACQSIILCSTLILLACRSGEYRRLTQPLLLIGLCLLSLFIAASRGGVLYSFLILIAAAVFYFFRIRSSARRSALSESIVQHRAWPLVVTATILVLVLSWVAFYFTSKDLRWQTMADKVWIGWVQPEPMATLCDGPTPEQELRIREAYKDRGTDYVDHLIMGLRIQDAGRILLMRVGVELVADNPRGLDGGRNTFQKMMGEKCGHVPVLSFAHLHHSWMDLALALGWGGAAIFAWLLLYFCVQGGLAIKLPEVQPWAIALAFLAAFWILRGFTDSAYREHYLQMQAMVMGYLFGRLRLESRVD